MKPSATVMHALTRDEVANRVGRLTSHGWGERQIADTFALSVQQVRQIIAARAAAVKSNP